jgi:uncharacterized protein (DUF58 family)
MTIVPSTKLIVWTAAVFLPVSVLIAFMPAITAYGVGVAAALLIVAVIDAAASRNLLDGVRVTLPELVRLSVGRDCEVTLSIVNVENRVRLLRVGLALPGEIYSSNLELYADLPEASLNFQMAWPIKALKQGRYLLENCYLETSSRLGLWSLRRADEAQSEIRVYPDLLGERKKLTGLFQNRGIGVHARRQVGKGREFEQLREYLPGDSYEDIHWKASAKRGQPITKVYQIERTQEIYIIIDASRMSARSCGTGGNRFSIPGETQLREYTTIVERFTAAALVMGLAAERQGDVFGLMAFDDRVRKFVRAKNGKAHYDACREALYTLQACSVTPDFAELFTFIATKIRCRALLLLLTNLDDPALAERFAGNIGLISRRHLVIVNTLKPAGADPLFANPDVNSLDDIYRRLGGHLVWRHLRETERQLHRRGVGFNQFEKENLCVDLVTQYMSVKQRQVL